MIKTKTSGEMVEEIFERLESMLELSPDYGKITMIVHMRDGLPQRYETIREESTLIKRGAFSE